MSRVPRASGDSRTDYAGDFALLQTRRERVALALFIAALCGFPYIASAFYLDLACQVFLAAVGSLSLMLLTGYAGQVSLVISPSYLDLACQVFLAAVGSLSLMLLTGYAGQVSLVISPSLPSFAGSTSTANEKPEFSSRWAGR